MDLDTLASPPAALSSLDLAIARTLDAPRARVFEAWIDPRQFVQWWSPPGMTTPLCEMDRRAGGVLRTVVRAPDGSLYRHLGRFHELAAPARLVFTTGFEENGFAADHARVAVAFDEVGDRTQVAIRWTHRSVAERIVHEQMGFQRGWSETLDRLHAFVTRRAFIVAPTATVSGAPATTRQLVITRVLAAPAPLVFAAWTQAGQVARWWGPHGFTASRCDVDPRVGGPLRIDLCPPGGAPQACRGSFRDVAPPDRLAFTTATFDASGQPCVRNLNTVAFAARSGRTQLTLHVAVLDARAEAAAALDGLHASWCQSLDRLADFVASLGAQSGSAENSDQGSRP